MVSWPLHRGPSAGFVALRREAIEPLLPALAPRGFKLLLEILAKSRGATVREMPILFVEREEGHSKFASSEVFAFLSLCLELRRR